MTVHVDDYQLIQLVESFPMLYDRHLARGYKNAALKDEAWKKVSIKMGVSERACVTRWKSLRDRFGKEYRRAQENPNAPLSWDLFPQLMFLKNHYKHGQVRDEALHINFEPKYRKRKHQKRTLNDDTQEDESFDDDVDPEELMTNQQLIGLVKEHPVLYDKQKIRDSKNLIAKNGAWEVISESLGISEEECFKRWKKLRDFFSREYRRQQLDPDKPVTWIYFQDLQFLESHYRKGISLPVCDIKTKKERKPGEETDNNFQSTDDEVQETVSDDEDQYKKMPRQSSAMIISQAETKLTNVIANIQNVLIESKDCLKMLQQQHNVQHHRTPANDLLQWRPQLQHKMYVLLDGLEANQRVKAEHKILEFLCDCQIKSLHNELVEDL